LMNNTKKFALILFLGFVCILNAQETKSQKAEVFDLGKGLKIEMVLIPAGKFQMGALESEKSYSPNEKLHEVTLTKSFYMGKYEVTQEQWELVMKNNPSTEKGHKLPVTDLSWEDTQTFCEKLNTLTKNNFRLPSEAEWEYSCRANTKTSYHFGETLTPANANYVDSKHGTTIKVGSYKPNDFGLYDMHGNVWEWCNDFFSEYPEGKTIDPKGPENGEFRTIRGGGFDAVTRLRAAFRNFSSPTDQTKSIGFRLALTKGT